MARQIIGSSNVYKCYLSQGLVVNVIYWQLDLRCTGLTHADLPGKIALIEPYSKVHICDTWYLFYSILNLASYLDIYRSYVLQ